MCSGGDKTAEALEKSQADFTNLLTADYSTVFGENQAISKQLQGTLTSQLQNPQGFASAELSATNTAIKEGVAGNYAQAQRAANAVAAAHGGGASLPSGVQAQVSGQIATSAAQQQSQEQNQLAIANAQQKQSNYWNAISGLSNTASLLNPNAVAGQATGAANSTSNLGDLVLKSKMADWQIAGGMIGAVGGLASGIAGLGGMGGGGGENYNASGNMGNDLNNLN